MVQSHIDEGMLLDAMEEEVRERGVATVYMCLEGAELISGVLPKDMCGFRWMLTEDLNFKGLVSEAEVFPFLLSSFNYRPGVPVFGWETVEAVDGEPDRVYSYQIQINYPGAMIPIL